MLQHLFPYRCLLCLAPGDGQDLCAPCRAELPWMGAACARCAAPLASAGTLCGRCLRHPPPLVATQAALHYAFPVDRLLLHLKFSGGLVAGRVLGELLADHLDRSRSGSAIREAEILVPVPLHPRRLRERGYNQALELALTLRRELKLRLLPAACRRVRATASQTGLRGRARRRNVADAFVAAPAVAGKHVALVDDVITTGSTVAAAAEALYRAGAASVQAWCVARA